MPLMILCGSSWYVEKSPSHCLANNLSASQYLRLFMKLNFAPWLVILFAAFACFGSAQAHSPYFSTAGKIILPNGKPGELRLLHGDGVFWADPIRVLALDEEGRMIARSPPSPSIAMSCLHARCRVFDLAEDVVLELDPTTFRTGALVPAIDNADRSLNWEIYGADNESWGWGRRKAGFLELIWGNLALARRTGMCIGFTIMAGFVAGPALHAAFRRRLTVDRPSLMKSMARLVWRLILLMIGAAAIFASFYLSVAFCGSTLTLWMVVLVGSAAVTLAISAALRRMDEMDDGVEPPSALPP